AAAIPAVVAYNEFANDISRYGARLDGLVADVVTVTSRELSEAG
ncbi:MAG: Tol-Pal system subunit TolQ, partial [Alphaproteobacteria bacterium]|nr:Tol-Pal system subunit TolQ [Alphaproteobacteria bacterium]